MLVGVKFSTPVQTVQGTHSALYIMGTGSFPEGNWQKHGVNHPTPSSPIVKERAELYLYSLSVLS